MIQTILVPLDGSPFSERALSTSCDLAHALNARLVLVCVAGPGTDLGKSISEQDRIAIDEQYASVREEDHTLSVDPLMVEHAQRQVTEVAEAERYLAGIAARLTGEGMRVETAVPYGRAADGILTEIELRKADLVVMSSHGRSGLARLIAGSVTQAVISRSPVPVMVVPSKSFA